MALGPASFDIDSDWRVWVLDTVKARVAVFGRRGDFLRDTPLGNLGYRSLDIQASIHHTYVLFQDRDLSAAFFVLEKANRRRLPVIFDGERTDSASQFSVQDDTAYLSLFVGGLTEEEIPAAVRLRPARRQVQATSVPGRPFLDGWFLFQPFKGDTVIPLAVESSDQTWTTDIQFTLLHPHRDRVRGHVGWELVIDTNGDLHLIIFAGTFGRDPVDGFWYLKVAKDGTVGKPIPLRNPSSNLHQQQNRMMSLGPDGIPIALFLDDSKATITSLAPLELMSLP